MTNPPSLPTAPPPTSLPPPPPPEPPQPPPNSTPSPLQPPFPPSTGQPYRWTINLHTDKSFRNLIESNRNQILFTMHRLIWNQTDVRLLFQINRCMVNKIWFRFDLIRFRNISNQLFPAQVARVQKIEFTHSEIFSEFS